jgi:hypothetical protein
MHKAMGIQKECHVRHFAVDPEEQQVATLRFVQRYRRRSQVLLF